MRQSREYKGSKCSGFALMGVVLYRSAEKGSDEGDFGRSSDQSIIHTKSIFEMFEFAL